MCGSYGFHDSKLIRQTQGLDKLERLRGKWKEYPTQSKNGGNWEVLS